MILKTSKGDDVTYKSHSIQINLNDCMSEKDFGFTLTQKAVPEDCLYREYLQIEEELFFDTIKKDDPREEYGLENIPHITVLYGLKEEKDYFDIREKLKNFGEIEFEIGDIRWFRPKDKPYDVIVLDIISPKLHEIHNYIKDNYANDYSFPEYIPHMTLAYVKKDSLNDFANRHFWKGFKYPCNLLRFSHKDKYFLNIPLE